MTGAVVVISFMILTGYVIKQLLEYKKGDRK